jgi:hypothetical protein
MAFLEYGLVQSSGDSIRCYASTAVSDEAGSVPNLVSKATKVIDWRREQIRDVAVTA